MKNEKTKENENIENLVIIDFGYGGGIHTSSHIIEGKQNANEGNDFTIIRHGTGGSSSVSE